MLKKIDEFFEKYINLITLIFLVIGVGFIVAVIIFEIVDLKLNELSEEYPPNITQSENGIIKMEIDLYEHIDPVTGVYWYIYEGHMYPRVNPDGSYYSKFIPDETPNIPVSSNYVRFVNEKENTEEATGD